MNDEVRCTHCGLPVPAHLVVPERSEQFCCSGCQRVYHLLRSSGLDDFYAIRERGGDLRPDERRPAVAEGRFDHFNSPAFRRDQVRTEADGACRCRFYVEGMHCAACVWLLEQLPRLTPGVRSARVRFGDHAIDVAFDSEHTDPAGLAQAIHDLGYRPHPWGDAEAEERRQRERRGWYLRFGITAASMMGAMHLGANVMAAEYTRDMEAHIVQLFGWGAFAAALPALTYGAWPYYRSALAGLRHRQIGIDLSVSLVILIGSLASLGNLLVGGDLAHDIYFDAMAMFVTFLLFARLVLLVTQDQVLAGSRGLGHLLPAYAIRRNDQGVDDIVAIDELRQDDLVRVDAEAVLPADGIAVATGRIDAAVLTGESHPQQVATGDPVFAGTTCLGSGLLLRARAWGEASRMGQLIQAVRQHAARPTRLQHLTDRVQNAFAPVVLILAAAVFWYWRGESLGAAWTQTIALILVACPCAFALAMPLAQAVAIGRASRAGILIRDGSALDRLRRPRHVVCDKTGTLTRGRMHLQDWVWEDDVPDTERRRLSALIRAAEARSSHPLAAAIAAAPPGAEDQVEPQLDATDRLEERPGAGLVLVHGDEELRIGNGALTGIDLAGRTEDDRIETPVVVTRNGKLIATLWIGDSLRPEAERLIRFWRSRGSRVHLCSGDSPAVTFAIGSNLGFAPADIHARATPEDKAELVRTLQQDGSVLMIGDGINDAPALHQADLGIGIRGGLEAAMQAGDIFLAKPDETPLLRLVQGAHQYRATVIVILMVALIYNLVGITMVAIGWWGPVICAIAMPASSLTVVALAAAGPAFRNRRPLSTLP